MTVRYMASSSLIPYGWLTVAIFQTETTHERRRFLRRSAAERWLADRWAEHRRR